METGRVQKAVSFGRSTAVVLLWALTSSLLAPAAPVEARTPERSIAQYQHTRWTMADGAPQLIYAMAQSPDGFIWLASESGLVRFDGLTFEQISPLSGDGSGQVTTVLVSQTGAVWAALRNSQRLVIYHKGQLTTAPLPMHEDGLIRFLIEAPDGSIWAGDPHVGLPLLRFADGQWRSIDATMGLPRSGLTSLLTTADGAIWAGYADYVLRLAPGRARFERVADLQSTLGRLALDGEGQVWLLDRGAARPISGPRGAPAGPLSSTRMPVDDSGRPGRPLFDRFGNLWEATLLGGVTKSRAGLANRQLDRFSAVHGLSSDATTSVLEDREGNIWVGAASGLDRFRRSPVVPEPGLSRPGPYGNVQFSASDGSVYIAETDTVYRVPAGGSPEVRLRGAAFPQGLCEGPDGTIWIVSSDAIRGLRPDGRTIVRARPAAAQRELSDCVVDEAGGLQVNAGGDGVFRWIDGNWQMLALSGGQPFLAKTFARDGAGRLWADRDQNALAQWTPQGWREVLSPEQLSTGSLLTLFPLARGTLFAGREGVGRHIPETGGAGLVRAFRGGTGLIMRANGDVWAFSSRGLIHMQAQAFARSLSDPAYDAPVRIFGPSDGLLSRHASQSWRSLVQGGDGRLWLATATGTAWIDPAGIPINRLAPSLAITKLEGRGVLERDPTAVQLKAGTSDLAISFSALSLGSPERVQVRYRLEGHDEDWVDPGQRRQAFYTNLRPGSYRFQVIAANEDGIWNRNGATLSFTIAPTFLQSIWFKFLCAIGVLGLASAAYLLRMRQVTAKLRDRFQIRIAERERIARELHDTWLQGVQGLMLSFQSVANRLPADSALRASVDGTLDRADNLIVDGRRRLRDLRRRAADTDLGQALADSAREVISSQSEARITIEGTQRPLDPTVAEELLRIAEEAMRNAVQHGDDVEIEVALVYARLELRLVIRDDGPGLPDDVLATGQRSGHFGLQGMQERAERIGARLEISSQPRRGTEVRITLPSLRAYRDGRTFDAARLFERAGLKQPYLPRGRR